jgi:hypothetical protein
LFFNFVLEYAKRKVLEKLQVLKLNGTQQFLTYTDDVNLLREVVNENTEALLDDNKDVGLEVNSELSTCIVIRLQDKTMM